ncbi:MAG: CinA family protein [Sulfitobacter sp.]|jgi:nicotinamide-nucleotide amidase|uniref:CinA family protein n=1 Tax=Sulfitobacter sp. TaxID=1903071 RepID=UPI000C0F945A|nr:damage-inducible protein CinA [Roseobacter sp.]MBV47057.1 damage-inducible protein CinA [Roseobacter sp.]PHR04709.1 MAG: damage-inducible protein CinA [Sulfitobacter sp.]THF90011.1 MAG: CinA family protein [Sulfitobacter sp. SK025]|tara:strand:- start:7140 stop:7619 length:480 start_codon:yes stop_codon:yes gene_type:complete
MSIFLPDVPALLDRARSRGVMIACAESCTGGMVAAALTDLPGSSTMFDRGFVTYTNAAKIDMLGVSASTLAACGAVSEPVAREMALGALSRSQAQVAVSVTGIAGPGGSEHKPEGRVCFAIAQGSEAISDTQEFGALGRDKVRKAARDHAIALLLRAIS